MKCTNCGTELKEGVIFCTECGTKVVYPSDSDIKDDKSNVIENTVPVESNKIQTSSNATVEKIPWYYSGWFLLILAYVVSMFTCGVSFIAAIILACMRNKKYKNNKNNTKILVAVIVPTVLLLVFSAWLAISEEIKEETFNKYVTAGQYEEAQVYLNEKYSKGTKDYDMKMLEILEAQNDYDNAAIYVLDAISDDDILNISSSYTDKLNVYVNHTSDEVTDKINQKLDDIEQAKAEQEAKEKAEAEAKAKAEQEAKEKAEAEAKAKAEQEAKEKAEQEAKEKAEAEAKAKAEQEAKEKAEAEAKAKAEQEAKEKAEAEARAKAEQEAKEKAEAEAKAKEKRNTPASLTKSEMERETEYYSCEELYRYVIDIYEKINSGDDLVYVQFTGKIFDRVKRDNGKYEYSIFVREYDPSTGGDKWNTDYPIHVLDYRKDTTSAKNVVIEGDVIMILGYVGGYYENTNAPIVNTFYIDKKYNENDY